MLICVIGMDDNAPFELEHALKEASKKDVVVMILRYDQVQILQILREIQPDALVISGSNYRVNNQNSPQLPLQILNLGIPILGVCYGFQWLIKASGGQVCTFHDTKLHKYAKYLEPYGQRSLYMFAHHDYICKLPKKWKPVIYSPDKDQVWMAVDETRKLTGIQFHPEKNKHP